MAPFAEERLMILGKEKKKLFLFGSTGDIGKSIRQKFELEQWLVINISRSDSTKIDGYFKVDWEIDYSVDDIQKLPSKLIELGPCDAICWAQGLNFNDSTDTFSLHKHLEMYQANVLYILATLASIKKHQMLSNPTRMVVISSIWQEIARLNKLSYSVTKSSLRGLINSLANELSQNGHLVNAVLPGVVDTQMTRNNLSVEQIHQIETSTGFSRLVDIEDVSNVVYYLCSNQNKSMSGQFITVDLGYSHVKYF